MKKPLISAPINVVTGTLGAGKTLFAIEQADLLIQSKQADVVYQLGINEPDLRKLPALPFPIEEWAMRADKGELKNAVIIVDEFHKWMPARGPGRPPKWIEEMAESRRRDVRWILLTQSGDFDHFLKGTRLNKHWHLSRKGYLNRSTIYEWSERFVNNPADNKEARKEAVLTNWWHPKKYYGWYVSAAAHRFKVRLPFRAVAALALIPVILYFGINGAKFMGGIVTGKGLATVAPQSSHAGVGDAGMGQGSRMEDGRSTGSRGASIRPTDNVGEYLTQFEPIIAQMPWSAPVYQGREVVAQPEIYCMSSGMDGRDGCNCYSEQGTKLSRVPVEICRVVAREGVYNPYRPPLSAFAAASIDGVRHDGGSDAPLAPAAAVAIPRPAEPALGTFPENAPYQVESYTGPTSRRL
ncbi:MAG: hypothetical protein FH747_04120 [Stenotrophomonas sp.]|uniref:zonular occludens toxin domain-containing protein n=1 Tax=Stenotrophomonas sp. TaxID=69392 RepID=UPI00135251A4|nr:zonular occludens toxin domain-containing protein [Stenotrophomonas sp.]MTI72833.1 hypothetical protein [Stenotrophomonas sp.]